MKPKDQLEKLKLVLLFKELQNLKKKLKIFNCEKGQKIENYYNSDIFAFQFFLILICDLYLYYY